jgi:hypothetical protein
VRSRFENPRLHTNTNSYANGNKAFVPAEKIDNTYRFGTPLEQCQLRKLILVQFSGHRLYLTHRTIREWRKAPTLMPSGRPNAILGGRKRRKVCPMCILLVSSDNVWVQPQVSLSFLRPYNACSNCPASILQRHNHISVFRLLFQLFSDKSRTISQQLSNQII